MFDYAFHMDVQHSKHVDTQNRYANKSYTPPITIKGYKTEQTIKVSTDVGFEFQNKTVFLTQTEVEIDDKLDDNIVVDVKVVLDIFGDFLYYECEVA